MLQSKLRISSLLAMASLAMAEVPVAAGFRQSSGRRSRAYVGKRYSASVRQHQRHAAKARRRAAAR